MRLKRTSTSIGLGTRAQVTDARARAHDPLRSHNRKSRWRALHPVREGGAVAREVGIRPISGIPMSETMMFGTLRHRLLQRFSRGSGRRDVRALASEDRAQQLSVSSESSTIKTSSPCNE